MGCSLSHSALSSDFALSKSTTGEHVFRTIEVLSAPADKIWSVLRPFNSTQWMRDVTSCNCPSGDKVGAVRTLMTGGKEIQEKLVARNDQAKVMTLSLLNDPGYPLTDAMISFALTPLGDSCGLTLVVTYTPRDVAAVETFLSAACRGYAESVAAAAQAQVCTIVRAHKALPCSAAAAWAVVGAFDSPRTHPGAANWECKKGNNIGSERHYLSNGEMMVERLHARTANRLTFSQVDTGSAPASHHVTTWSVIPAEDTSCIVSVAHAFVPKQSPASLVALFESSSETALVAVASAIGTSPCAVYAANRDSHLSVADIWTNLRDFEHAERARTGVRTAMVSGDGDVGTQRTLESQGTTTVERLTAINNGTHSITWCLVSGSSLPFATLVTNVVVTSRGTGSTVRVMLQYTPMAGHGHTECNPHLATIVDSILDTVGAPPASPAAPVASAAAPVAATEQEPEPKVVRSAANPTGQPIAAPAAPLPATGTTEATSTASQRTGRQTPPGESPKAQKESKKFKALPPLKQQGKPIIATA